MIIYWYLKPDGDLESRTNYVNIGRFWMIDDLDRSQSWRFLIEAAAYGADRVKINELRKVWRCHSDDLRRYLIFLELDYSGHDDIEVMGVCGENLFEALVNYYVSISPEKGNFHEVLYAKRSTERMGRLDSEGVSGGTE